MFKCLSSLRCCFFPPKLNISANELIGESPKSGNDLVINNHDNQSNYEPFKLITINSLIYPQSINYISSQTENSDRLLIYPVRLVGAENSLPLAEAISPPPSPSLTASQGFNPSTSVKQFLLV